MVGQAFVGERFEKRELPRPRGCAPRGHVGRLVPGEQKARAAQVHDLEQVGVEPRERRVVP